jgi:hypothetical protein
LANDTPATRWCCLLWISPKLEPPPRTGFFERQYYRTVASADVMAELLIGILAAAHRTWNFDQALRRELYPHLSA